MKNILSSENMQILKTRGIALLWHVGAMVGIVIVDFVTTNINLFNIPDWAVVMIGLVAAQITKYLNTPKD